MKLRGVDLELYEHEAVCSVIRESGDFYEAGILDALRQRRPQEKVMLDVGAHIGNHSLYWAAFTGSSAIISFEPYHPSYQLLNRNLAPFPHALPLPLAVSDVAGVVRMQEDEVNRGRTAISAAGTEGALAIRLDDLGLTDVSFLKIDVEGHQAHVLRGAKQLLASWHPALLVEDGEELVQDTLCELYLCGYQKVASYPGSNGLWEWA